MIIVYKNNELNLDGRLIYFNQTIKAIIEYDDCVIVQLWNSSSFNIQDQPINNVYIVNYETKSVLNIVEIVQTDGVYTGIFLDESERLVVIEFIGKRFIIDIKNMRLIESKAYK